MHFVSAKLLRASIPVLTLLLLLPAAAPAPAPLAAPEWSNAATPGGGPVQGIGGSALVLVASTWNDGTYASHDNGLHWARLDAFPPVTEARVAFDPADPATGYVYGFGGVARTRDAGATWTHVLDTTVTYRLALGPGGALLASWRDAEQFTHVLRSFDGGDSWHDLGALPDRWTSVYGLQFGRSVDEVVAMSISRMWVTHDAGATWTTSNHTSLELARAPDGTLWRAGWTLERSVDGGATWVEVAAPDTGRPLVITPEGAMVMATYTGLYTSADAGATWEALGFAEATWGATSVLPDPREPGAFFVGDEFVGVVRIAPTSDGYVLEGRTTGLPPVDVLALGASRDGSILLAGSSLGLYASRDGGDSWGHTGAASGMLGVFSVAASDDGQTLLAGGMNRVFQPFVTLSHDGGRTFETRALHLGGDGVIAGIAFEPGSATHAFAAAKMDLASSHVLETTDGGRTWTKLFTLPQKIRDVAWDASTGQLLVASELGVLAYADGVWSVRGETLNTWTVAAEAGRAWSNGPQLSLWSGAEGGLLLPWADTGDYLVDLAPQPGARAVWATNDDGRVFRCAEEPLLGGACADAAVPGKALASLVRPEGARVFAATWEGGIYSADI